MEKEITFDRGMIYEMYSDLKNLNDMQVRHSGEIKNDIRGIWAETSAIKETQHRIEKDLIDRVHDVEKAALQKTAALGQKIAAVTVIISIVVSIASGVMVELIVKKVSDDKDNKSHNSPVDHPSRERDRGYGDSWEEEYTTYFGVSPSDLTKSNDR